LFAINGHRKTIGKKNITNILIDKKCLDIFKKF